MADEVRLIDANALKEDFMNDYRMRPRLKLSLIKQMFLKL